MSAQQQLVGAAGVALVVTNAWTRNRDTIKDLVGLDSANIDPATRNRTNQLVLKNLGLQVIAVGVLTLLAGTSRSTGNGMLAIVTGLWILWAVQRTPRFTVGEGTSGTGGPNRRI